MSKINFHKYQATGNDFVMLDNRDGKYNDLSISQIQWLCDRRFGIGGDGLIKINAHNLFDFEVDYYNADGTKSFCGNGARSSVLFAQSLGLIQSKCHFTAIDGEHTAFIDEENLIHLDMNSVDEVTCQNADFVLHTGSPHYIQFVEQLTDLDIVQFGKEIRYSDQFKAAGINVNLVQKTGENQISMLTYERGVEDETLSCGTGATAAAIAFAFKNSLKGFQKIAIQVKGGDLLVSFIANENGTFESIKLIGPAKHVFEGEING